MTATASADIFELDDFHLDRRSGVLSRRNHQGVFMPVALGGRALDVLGVLVEHPGDVVSRDMIMSAVWPGTVVEDGNLSVQISTLRRVLDDGRSEDSLIQTVPGRGYRFVGQVTRHDPDPLPFPASSRNDRADTDTDADFREESPPKVLGPTAINRGPPVGALSGWHWLGIGFLGIALCLIGIVAPVFWPSSDPLLDQAVTPTPRLSMVVLPFNNLSNDPEQQHFVNGVTEDLTTDLSRIAGSFVISRNSAFTYKDKAFNAKRIGRELGVRYVLEGSVQRSGNRVRVNTQLIDAETDAHLWAERFDNDIGDLLGLQNEITSRIAIALNLALVGAEAARSSNNPDALDFILRGRAAALKPASGDNYAERISMFEHALTADPGSVEAQSRLAGTLVDRVLDFGSSTAEADLKRAEELATKAVTASPRSEVAHFAKAQVLRAQRRCGEAIPEYETALALNRNSVAALAHIGRCKIYIGPIEEAIRPQDQAIRLSPLDPSIAIWYYRIGEAHLLQSHIDDAILWFEKARSANEGLSYVHVYLASAYALNGETNRAAAEIAEARKLSGEGAWLSLARVRASRRYETPTIRALAEATLYAGLRKAGMPEE